MASLSTIFTDERCRDTPLIPPEKYPELFDPDKHRYKEYLSKAEFKQAVDGNRRAIEASDIVVLLLPAGVDAHSDWAYGIGKGKVTIVVGHPIAGERHPVHLWADFMVDTEEECIRLLLQTFP